ncbi:trypco2 family protein [Neoaquamicrobium sediminum]|uniref:Trypco2 family protein n=1 Tax=Neoaquamicrobium sediminum TaxID=1849104 RepID=A0ABV3WZ02_9HYPH
MDVQIILNALFAIAVVVAAVTFWRVGGRLLKATTIHDPNTDQAEIVGSVLLRTMISDIKSELQKLDGQGGIGSGLELKEIEIELLVQRKNEDKGEGKAETSITVPIFSKISVENGITLSRTETHTTKVTVTLAPDFPKMDAVDETRPLAFADLLISIRDALEAGIEDPPTLSANALEIELSFVLVKDKTTEGKFEVLVVSAGATTSAEDKNSNTVKLTFEHPDAGKERKPAAAPPKPRSPRRPAH